MSEYGDWEYYAGNAGLNQEGWADLAPGEGNSRKLRWHGEKGLLQQATNFQEAHSGNLQTAAIGEGPWVMFDYLRGYAPDVEASGCMDLFRLPKLSYYFFQSQRDPAERYSSSVSGPMVFVASYWTPTSSINVRIFSNCDEVELYLNDVLLERRAPDTDRITLGIAHPPFTFAIAAFEPGLLEAVAYIGGAEVARHSVRTPGPPRQLELRVAEGRWPFAEQAADVVLVHAELKDADGSVVPDAWEKVSFGATGSARLVGRNPFSSDAGIASIVLQADHAARDAIVYAVAIVEDAGQKRVLSASLAVNGSDHPYDVRFTTDGTEASADSPSYAQPLADERVRAVIVASGEVVAAADSSTPTFRTRGNSRP